MAFVLAVTDIPRVADITGKVSRCIKAVRRDRRRSELGSPRRRVLPLTLAPAIQPTR